MKHMKCSNCGQKAVLFVETAELQCVLVASWLDRYDLKQDYVIVMKVMR